MYLLTTTAASYFQRLGFAPFPRDQVDGAVQASFEFRELCCATAVAMVQTLIAGAPRGKACMTKGEQIKQHVRLFYGERVLQGNACCADSSCCAPQESTRATASSEAGFADLVGPSLSCGSPLAFAELSRGETIVDLGSGAGREVLRAAAQVGVTGKSIGIDMTPEMVWKARENVEQVGMPNAEFMLGEIEHLPLADASADVIISNCVINLGTR